ncbi:MAG: metallophosphoesterase family protein [Nitrospirae bacterium]|nr:metallophosphoesterase family protein [Nitrospirota bacterium]
MTDQNRAARQCTIGVISDTHGLLRPQAVGALEGSDLIVHAGDIGSPEVLNRLKTIAPLFAVRGNTDHGPWLKGIPVAESVQWCGFFFHILHDLARLDLDPQAAGMHILISGHTHIPAITRKQGILYLNPGSAGPRRFSLPITLGRITIKKKELSPEIISLEQ